MKKNERIWCETIDGEARNVIQSSEQSFSSELRWLPRHFALEGKDFS
jgi:hypothetical protein